MRQNADTPKICRNKKQSGSVLMSALLPLPWLKGSVYCKNAYFTEKLNIQRME